MKYKQYKVQLGEIVANTAAISNIPISKLQRETFKNTPFKNIYYPLHASFISSPHQGGIFIGMVGRIVQQRVEKSQDNQALCHICKSML